MYQVLGTNWLDNEVILLVGSLINQLLSYWEFPFLLGLVFTGKVAPKKRLFAIGGFVIFY